MSHSPRLSAVLVLAGFGVAALAATGCAQANAMAKAPDPSSSVPGEVLVAEKCRTCHTLERVRLVSYDQKVWTATVDRMRSNGLVVNDTEATAIVEYLAARDAKR